MSRILVIDDERAVQGALKAVLSQKGHDVLSAFDGPKGLAILKQEKPDLIILDRDLPEMTGSQVLQEIRKINRSVRVIVLTGNPYAKGEEKYKTLGVSAFLSKDSPMEEILAAIENELAPQKTMVLVIDDDKDIRIVLQRFLEGKNYQAQTAANGEEGLEALKKSQIQLILLDIEMPGIGGVETLRRIREAYPAVSVIMISGNTDEELARKCMQLGACDYIVKPLDLDYLEMTAWAKILTAHR